MEGQFFVARCESCMSTACMVDSVLHDVHGTDDLMCDRVTTVYITKTH